MKKRYISISAKELHFSVVVGGKNVLISFAGGINSNGVFVTKDKDVQIALEESSMYGKKFTLEEGFKPWAKEDEKPILTPLTPIDPPSDGAGEGDGTDVIPPTEGDGTGTGEGSGEGSGEDANKLIELQAGNKQLAIEELVTLFPEFQSQLDKKPNNSVIEELANSKGYTFVNLAK